MNIFEYEFNEPSRNSAEDKPKAVRMHLNNAPIDEIAEEERQFLSIHNLT